jgi:hypothetical protein
MATTAKAHGEDQHDHPHGWRRFVYSTNHKDIGTMYLVFALVGGLISGTLSIGMRLELMHPPAALPRRPHVQRLHHGTRSDHDLHGHAGDDGGFGTGWCRS